MSKKHHAHQTGADLTKKEAAALLSHHGKSEKEGSYDDTVVASHDGKDVTIGQLRKGKLKLK
jgi:hypothetical protein